MTWHLLPKKLHLGKYDVSIRKEVLPHIFTITVRADSGSLSEYDLLQGWAVAS